MSARKVNVGPTRGNRKILKTSFMQLRRELESINEEPLIGESTKHEIVKKGQNSEAALEQKDKESTVKMDDEAQTPRCSLLKNENLTRHLKSNFLHMIFKSYDVPARFWQAQVPDPQTAPGTKRINYDAFKSNYDWFVPEDDYLSSDEDDEC